MSNNKSNGSISEGELSYKDMRDNKQSSRNPTKAKTTLDTSQLEKLILDHQKLNNKIKKLIEEGVNEIQSDAFQQAINCFQQAQNILQYAANCGKSIDRTLIIATLENKACIYQRLWEQQKSYNYIEAILYNFNTSTSNSNNSYNLEQFEENSAINLYRKQTLALYHLKFSAVASQIKNHETALSSAFKAMKIMHMVCRNSYQLILKKQKLSQETQKSLLILKQIYEFEEKIDISRIQDYRKRAKTALLALNNKKQALSTPNVREEIQSFTIGEVMQIFPVTIEQLATVPSIQEQTSYLSTIYKAIYYSISFFAAATQLRLITPSKILHTKMLQSQQFIKSQIYHLNSIYICSKFIPFSTQYLNHIIKSYSNHYESEIKGITDDYDDQQNQDHRVVVKQKDAKRKKSKNNNFHQHGYRRSDDFIVPRQDIRMNTIYKPKKIGMKPRNSSVQMHSTSRPKKSLSKQKSSCTVKKNQKILRIEIHKQELTGNHLPTKSTSNAEFWQKDKKQKEKIGHLKSEKNGANFGNKSSKSKSKSPSVNIQMSKKKSPTKKAKKNKFMQEYYLNTDLQPKNSKNIEKMQKKKSKYSKATCEYKDGSLNSQYMRSSDSDMHLKSKFEEYEKNAKNKQLKKKQSNTNLHYEY